MDEIIFLWLNSYVDKVAFLDGLILFFAKYYIYVMAAWVVGMGLLRFARNDGPGGVGFALASALIARFGVTELVRFFYNRPRPFEIIEGARQLVEHSGGGSFPSGHAAFAFALAAAISFYYPRVGIFFWMSAILIGISRIAAGVHWPSDIFGGAVVGIGTAWFLRWLFKKPRRSLPNATLY